MERDVVANYDIMKEIFIAVYSQNKMTWSLGVPVLADFEEPQLNCVYSFESLFPLVDLPDTRFSFFDLTSKYYISTSILEP